MEQEAPPLKEPSAVQETEPPLSKNALKRQLKRKRWEESKPERLALKKAKLKEKKETLRQSGQKLRKRAPKVYGQQNSGIRVVIDCAFDDFMIEKEIVSMNTQLTRCHAENKKSLKPVDLYITSLDKRLGERMENAMQGMHHRWKGVQISTQPYQDVLTDVPSQHLVYLTADSPNVINSLEKEKVYIIGGIVDKNRHKSLCFDKAVKQGIQHGRLPIGDYIKMAARHVLTVNQVLEIMLQWLETKDWETAFRAIIPARKLPEGKQDKAVLADGMENGKEVIESEDDESENETVTSYDEDGNHSRVGHQNIG